MEKNHKDLQPWLDYFDMLQTYENKGYLELQLDKHEAYVTQPALHAMSKGEDPQEQLRDGSITETVRRILSYAAFRSTKGSEYTKPPFAIHVVQPEPPHDLLYTLLITHRKSCRTLLRWRCNIEIIDYKSEMNGRKT